MQACMHAYAQPKMFKHFNLITTCYDVALRVVIFVTVLCGRFFGTFCVVLVFLTDS